MEYLKENLSVDQVNDIIKSKFDWEGMKSFISAFVDDYKGLRFTLWPKRENAINCSNREHIKNLDRIGRSKGDHQFNYLQVLIDIEKDMGYDNEEIADKIEDYIKSTKYEIDTEYFTGDPVTVRPTFNSKEENRISISFAIKADFLRGKDFHTRIDGLENIIPDKCITDFEKFVTKHKLNSNAISDFADFVGKYVNEAVEYQGHMYDKYGKDAWDGVYDFLIEEGYDDGEANCILQSKHMRWANDVTNELNLKGFKKYYNQYKHSIDRTLDKEYR